METLESVLGILLIVAVVVGGFIALYKNFDEDKMNHFFNSNMFLL